MDNAVNSLLPVWACLASLLAVPLIVLFRKEIFLREMSTFIAGFIKFGMVLAMLPIILSGKTITTTLVEGIAGINVPIVFRVDALGITLSLIHI